MKISSNQIIIFLVAFLIGIGVASYIKDANKAEVVKKEITTEVTVENGEETENGTTTGTTEAPGSGATVTATTDSTPKTVTGNCYTSLSGYKDTKLNAIVLNWSACESDDFQFYKLVKSSKNSNPTYPADPVAYSSPNKNAANFVDKTVAARTTYYYRMCVVQRLGAVNCSNVATVSY